MPSRRAAVRPATPPLPVAALLLLPLFESPSGRKNDDTAGSAEMFLSREISVGSEQRGRAWTRKPPAALTWPVLSRETPRARAQLT